MYIYYIYIYYVCVIYKYMYSYAVYAALLSYIFFTRCPDSSLRHKTGLVGKSRNWMDLLYVWLTASGGTLFEASFMAYGESEAVTMNYHELSMSSHILHVKPPSWWFQWSAIHPNQP